jgi:hypothetical protein
MIFLDPAGLDATQCRPWVAFWIVPGLNPDNEQAALDAKAKLIDKGYRVLFEPPIWAGLRAANTLTRLAGILTVSHGGCAGRISKRQNCYVNGTDLSYQVTGPKDTRPLQNDWLRLDPISLRSFVSLGISACIGALEPKDLPDIKSWYAFRIGIGPDKVRIQRMSPAGTCSTDDDPEFIRHFPDPFPKVA